MALTLEERVTRLEEKIFPPVCQRCGGMITFAAGFTAEPVNWRVCIHGHKWIRHGDEWEEEGMD